MNNNLLPEPYRMICPLGKGGWGKVYLAYHDNLRKQVVVKKIKEEYQNDEVLRIEVDILKNLHHQYLPQVYDFVKVNGQFYTVMDYIPGHDLGYHCNNKIHFSEERLLVWLRQLLEVLAYLHSRKPVILHCDLKPENIMITEEGNVCLIDFNISMDGKSNHKLFGLSREYASPEQIKKAELIMRGEDDSKIILDRRSDIYSVGAVWYFLMTGVYPYRQTGDFIELKYFEMEYSDALVNIVTKAMDLDPNKRFKRAEDMLKALDHMERWSSQRIRQRKAIVAGSVTAAVIGILGSAGAIYHYERSQYQIYENAIESYIEKEAEWQYLNSEKQETESLYEEGISILNRSKYQKYLRKDHTGKAQILYAAGSCALYLEDYREAVRLLEEAVELETDQADLYRDLALANAGEADLDTAETNLRMAKRKGADEADICLIQAEIYLEKGEGQRAYEIMQSVLQDLPQDMMSHAVNTLFQAAGTSGHTEECITDLIQKASSMPESTRIYWMRRAAQKALELGEDEIAQNCLEEILQSGIVLMEDRYNLDAVYEKEGMWDKSLEILKEMEKDYPEEYKVYIRMAYVTYRKNNDKRLADRSYKEVFQYYKKACQLMEKKGIKTAADPDMVQLETIIEQVKTLGWGSES